MSEFLGFQAIHLDNGLLRAAIVPDIGGRVLQFWLGEHPFLFANPHLAGRLFTPEENWGDGTLGSWKNYGGNKTWPAPQGWSGPDQWAGPPDPVLDSGRFRVLSAEPARASVQSPPDPRSGLQITRELSLAEGSARAVSSRTMRNVSDRPVRWSLWDVTQLECANRATCRMTVPLNPASRFPGGYQVMVGDADNPQWRTDDPTLFRVEYARQLGKVGLDSQAGWIAFSDGEWVFVHQFEVVPGAAYPDGGATVEVWTHGPGILDGVDFSQEHLRGELMEMEVLGPMVTIAPGEEASADLVWATCRCPGPIVDVTEKHCTSQRLVVEHRGGAAHVRASFGFFQPTRVQLRDRSSGQVLLEREAGPLAPLKLDDDIRAPDGEVEVVFSP
jgi:hypothetical protein